MTKQLPKKLLHRILSSKAVDRHQLTVLCRVNKLFRDLVTPLIYVTIVIEGSNAKFEYASYRRSEDGRLLKTARIERKAKAQKVEKVKEAKTVLKGSEKKVNGSKSKTDTKKRAESRRRRIEPKKEEDEVSLLLQALIEGKVCSLNRMDPDHIEAIFIQDVFGNPTSNWLEKYRAFDNLRDLSVVCRHGGLNILQDFLMCRLPRLERLLLFDIKPGSGEKVPTNDPRSPYECTQVGSHDHTGVTKLSFFDKSPLQVLVSPTSQLSPRSLDWFQGHRPLFQHLSILTHDEKLSPVDKYAVVYVSTRSDAAAETHAVLRHLSHVAYNFYSYSLEYLALPSRLEHDLSNVEGETIKSLIKLEVAVHYDGGFTDSIEPPSFFRFRKEEGDESEKTPRKKKREEEVEETPRPKRTRRY